MGKDLYEIGEIPPIGEVPKQMHAQLVRPDRFGDPTTAILDEVVDVPELGPHDALVMAMACGCELQQRLGRAGHAVDVTKGQARCGEPTDFHIVGSDAAGVVYAVGDQVTNVEVGDRVVVHAGQWDLDDPWVQDRAATRASPPASACGVTRRAGAALAQFCKVQAHQCLPKADFLTWEEAATPDAHGRDRLPHALRMAPAHRRAGRRRTRLGRERRARLARGAARRERRRACDRGREQRGEGRVREAARRGRVHQPQGLRPLGHPAALEQPRVEGLVRRREGVRQGDLGRARRDA